MKLEIIKNNKRWYLISSVIIIIGLTFGFLGGFDLGIDFTGGTMMHIDMEQHVSVDEIRNITHKYDLNESIVHIGADKNEIMLKTKQSLSNEERTEIYNDISQKYNLEKENLLAVGQFGPSIGDETKKKAVISVLIASLGMLVYIALRFEIIFAMAAVIALLHDILMMIAFYGLFRIPINGPFIAAILITVGYSINDTIVVFDRVRENVEIVKKKKYGEIVDMSIRQTISRSINTSVTTLLAIICLYIFGVQSIKEFTLPLIAGIVSGTYSSIFIASPIWYNLNMIFNKPRYVGK